MYLRVHIKLWRKAVSIVEFCDPIELTESELDLVAGGNAIVQKNHAHVAIGNGNTVTNGSGDVYIGTDNSVSISQSNSNTGSVS
jgi:hypothetical protein